MQTVNVTVTDGRYLINTPDSIIVRLGLNDPVYVSPEIWSEYTGGVKVPPYTRGQSFKLTVELYKALKNAAVSSPEKTNSTIPSNLPDNTCHRCGGLGHIEAYKHTNNGVCFECNGSGQV